MNPLFTVVLSTQSVLAILMSQTGVQFAPGLLDVLTCATPPTIAYFKSLPTFAGKYWAVYLLVLEKAGCRPRIYIGCGTESVHSVVTRFRLYNRCANDLPRYVQAAVRDGYKIVHKGFLCWAPMPPAGKRFPIVAMFLALEAMFAIKLWAMYSRVKDYCMPHLCSWDLDTMEYDGCCSHVALAEGIRGERIGCTPEQIAAKELAMEERRKEQIKASSAKMDPVVKKATARRSYKKAIAEKRHHCSVCGTSFEDNHQLNLHKNTAKYLRNVAGESKVYKVPAQKAHEDKVKASRKFYCPPCNLACVSQSVLNAHKLTQGHAKKSKAAEKAA